MSRHVKKNDMVQVMAGKHKGQRGRVLEVIVDADRVRVEGIAVMKRHLKPGRDQKLPNGGITEKLGSLHISNVLPIDPSTDKPTRVGFKKLDDGRKVRVAKKSGEQLTDK
jgi:large subunit ribosomal protein L24